MGNQLDEHYRLAFLVACHIMLYSQYYYDRSVFGKSNNDDLSLFNKVCQCFIFTDA